MDPKFQILVNNLVSFNISKTAVKMNKNIRLLKTQRLHQTESKILVLH